MDKDRIPASGNDLYFGHSAVYSGIKVYAGTVHELFYGNLSICVFRMRDHLLYFDHNGDHCKA